MKPEEFYDKRNAVENKKEKIGLSDSRGKVLKILIKHNIKRFLDTGCGDIFLSKNILENCDIEEYHGIDISDSGVLEAQQMRIKAIKLNVDQEYLPYKDNYFDFIFAGELIEHLFDPDHLLLEVYRVLKEEGYFMLTTPNLASWHNRIALLLGYQPHYSEVSTKYSVGKLMTTDKYDVSGHLRLFTLRALKELLYLYNFKIIKIIGHGTEMFIDKYISNHFPAFATGLIVLCQKKIPK